MNTTYLVVLFGKCCSWLERLDTWRPFSWMSSGELLLLFETLEENAELSELHVDFHQSLAGSVRWGASPGLVDASNVVCKKEYGLFGVEIVNSR